MIKHFSFLSAWLPSLWLVQAAAYQAVVVDATTSRPLAGVTVEVAGQQGAGLVTDQWGRITLPAAGAPARLRLSHIGYGALEVQRDLLRNAQPDTIRLLPQAYALADVVVHPRQQLVLSPFGHGRPAAAAVWSLVPGNQVAMLYLPPDSATDYRLNQIRLHLDAHRAEEGKIRIRVVNVVNGQPGTHDLLPVPAVFSARELNEMPDNVVVVEVAEYGIKCPKSGACIVVEAQSDIAGEQL